MLNRAVGRMRIFAKERDFEAFEEVIGVAHGMAFPLSGQGRRAEVVISELNGWPACALVNASPAMLP